MASIISILTIVVVVKMTMAEFNLPKLQILEHEGEREFDMNGHKDRGTLDIYAGDEAVLLGYDTRFGSLGSILMRGSSLGYYKWEFIRGPITYKIFCSETYTFDREKFAVTGDRKMRRWLSILNIQPNQSGKYVWTRIFIEPFTFGLYEVPKASITYTINVHVLPTRSIYQPIRKFDDRYELLDTVLPHVTAFSPSNRVTLKLTCPIFNDYEPFKESDVYWIKINDPDPLNYTSGSTLILDSYSNDDIYACGSRSDTLTGFISIVHVLVNNCTRYTYKSSGKYLAYTGQYEGKRIGQSIEHDGCSVHRDPLDQDGLSGYVDDLEKSPCKPNTIIFTGTKRILCSDTGVS